MKLRETIAAMAVVLTAVGLALAADPVVSNVRAAQRLGTPYVDITYDLADVDTATLAVTVAVSTNGGAVYFTPAAGLSGDLGGAVARGTGRKIVWNAGAALPPKLYSSVRAQVSASDSPAPSGMVAIPAGTNNGTDPDSGAYSLTVAAFYMDATEVTKAKWNDVYAWAITHGYSFSHSGSGKATNHPVHTVSWYDCVKWCNARSQKEGRTPCYNLGDWSCNFAANGYRLPTNMEWEYAARSGSSSKRFPWGDTISHSQANYHSTTYWVYDTSPTRGDHPTYATGGYPYTSPVGAFAANGYGLYDMAGNVLEWCNDTSGSDRNYRGGCWYTYAGSAQCGDSGGWADPDYANIGLGFRAVCR